MVPQLPLETSEAIIDHLYQDRPSLYACSLVCKAWVPKCRFYIFSDISIDYEDNSEKLSTFLNIMRSPQRPGRYVRSLSLHMHHHWQAIEGIPILAEYLTHVQTLLIQAMDWDHLNTAGRTAILSGFQTVRELSLEDTVFSTLTHTTELISSFPSLNLLDCSGFDISPDLEDLPTPLDPPPPQSLRTLILEGLGMARRIIPWLMATECRISHANLTLTESEDLEHVVELFKRLGPSLQLLNLNVYVEEDPEEIAVDLSQNIALSYLRINCGSVGDEEVSDVYLSFISQTLSQIRSSQLQTLYLEMPVHDEDLDSPIWSDLEHILAHPRFSLVQNLTFKIDSTKVDNDNIRNHVKQRMPRLVARGIIYFYQIFGGGLVPF